MICPAWYMIAVVAQPEMRQRSRRRYHTRVSGRLRCVMLYFRLLALCQIDDSVASQSLSSSEHAYR